MTASLKITASEHAIKSVTVFKSKAEVVRTFALELGVRIPQPRRPYFSFKRSSSPPQSGQTKVEITGLPGTIHRDSIRVSGLGQARLFDVVCTIDNKTIPGKDSPSEVIRLLKKEKLELESQKGMLETQAEILVQYAKTLTGEHITPSDMSQFLDTFSERSRKTLRELSEVTEEIVDVDRRISEEIAMSNIKKGLSTGKVSVVIGTDEPGSVELKLTYSEFPFYFEFLTPEAYERPQSVVDDASWEPTYELHAKTDNGKPLSGVSLHYRARVNQSTGEDWTDTALTLSTVSSDIATGTIPNVRVAKLRPQGKGFPYQNFQQQQQVQQQPMAKGGLFGPQQQAQMAQIPQQQQQSSFVANIAPRQTLFGESQNHFGGVGGGAFPTNTGLFGSNMSSNALYASSNVGFGTSAGFGPSTTPPPLRHLPGDSSDALYGDTVPEPISTEEEDAFEKIGEPAAILEPTTVVSESPLAISFAVEGKSTIPSDGVSHQASIAVLPFESKVTHVTVPRVQPNVYLQVNPRLPCSFGKGVHDLVSP